MLEKGANPNCTDPGRDSPLILAIKKNIENVVLSLLNAGADVSHIGEDGVTVLEVCINRKYHIFVNIDFFRFLLMTNFLGCLLSTDVD